MGSVSAQLLETAPAEESASRPPETIAATVTVKEKDSADRLTSHLLMWSFMAAVLLAIAGFVVVTVYLFQYLAHAFDSFGTAAMEQLSAMPIEKMTPILTARTGLWKFILQSCGIICGAAFGFLGFALFLLGAKGEMDATFDDSQHKVQITRMAPGAFVILVSTVLIGICAINKVTVEIPGATVTTTMKVPLATDQKPSDGKSPDPAENPAQQANPNPQGNKTGPARRERIPDV